MDVDINISVLKFNIDGVARGKPKLTRIRGVLHNSKGRFSLLLINFYKYLVGNVILGHQSVTKCYDNATKASI